MKSEHHMTTPYNRQVVICPIHETYFSGRLWMGLDYKKIKDNLASALPSHKIEISSLNAIAHNLSLLEEKSALFLTSSYDKPYQKYICDVMRHISKVRSDVLLIPNYDIMLAHENKGYQELIKKELGIEDVNGNYYGDLSDLDPDSNINYPCVVKLLEGSMSSNVFLVNSYRDLSNKLRKYGNKNIRYDIKRILKNYIIKNKYKLTPNDLSIRNYDQFFRERTPFIIQDYVKNLNYDYKILIFGQKYYALKRYVRNNDFRASGSGNFVYEPPSLELLDYAKKIFSLLDAPFVSLDIAEHEGKCYLIEFQGIGFGPITLENSSGYYTYSASDGEDKWSFVEENPDLEQSYADAIKYFINSRSRSDSESVEF